MPKRGESLPWKVRYIWTREDGTQVKGTVARHSKDEANMKANEITQAGLRRDDASVVVTVSHEPKGITRA